MLVHNSADLAVLFGPYGGVREMVADPLSLGQFKVPAESPVVINYDDVRNGGTYVTARGDSLGMQVDRLQGRG